LEIDHLFVGSNAVMFPASAIAVTRSDNIRQDVDMGTVRVNYRFASPIVAK
jgi:outer membrane immunogenic protein